MIPYTVDRRPDTGVTNVTMGIWLLLASEAMLFGALFSSYALLRTTAVNWPTGRGVLNVPIGSLNTILLAAVAGLMWRARAATPSSRRRWLAGGALGGLLFVVLLVVEYSQALAQGVTPAANTFLATYFTLTGVHAIHVLLGVVANTWTLAGALRAPVALTGGRMLGLSWYWAFVAVVWLVMFGLLYL